MRPTLHEALRVLEVVREGYVVLDHIGRGETGRAKCEENVVKRLMERLCRKAGLPESGWHRLRHSFGTHDAANAAQRGSKLAAETKTHEIRMNLVG